MLGEGISIATRRCRCDGGGAVSTRQSKQTRTTDGVYIAKVALRDTAEVDYGLSSCLSVAI